MDWSYLGCSNCFDCSITWSNQFCWSSSIDFFYFLIHHELWNTFQGSSSFVRSFHHSILVHNLFLGRSAGSVAVFEVHSSLGIGFCWFHSFWPRPEFWSCWAENLLVPGCNYHVHLSLSVEMKNELKAQKYDWFWLDQTESTCIYQWYREHPLAKPTPIHEDWHMPRVANCCQSFWNQTYRLYRSNWRRNISMIIFHYYLRHLFVFLLIFHLLLALEYCHSTSWSQSVETSCSDLMLNLLLDVNPCRRRYHQWSPLLGLAGLIIDWLHEGFDVGSSAVLAATSSSWDVLSSEASSNSQAWSSLIVSLPRHSCSDSDWNDWPFMDAACYNESVDFQLAFPSIYFMSQMDFCRCNILLIEEFEKEASFGSSLFRLEYLQAKL